jgi:hypothetical protein
MKYKSWKETLTLPQAEWDTGQWLYGYVEVHGVYIAASISTDSK